jgi:ribulose-5-phosphate 4-epimerase/fuculose-1-phosphate aldolase
VKTGRDEGVIKFKYTLKRAPAPEMSAVINLEKWRALFFKLGFVGEYQNEKIGYGNLSYRLKLNSFLITGSQTGHLAHLQAHHYTKVIDCDLKKGSVAAEGLIPPSSESLTHYSLYLANQKIQAIFHIHHASLWNFMIESNYDSIPDCISYGSKEMADYANQLSGNKSSGLFVMKGHEDGIVSYGTTPEEAGKNILEVYRKLSLRQ